ncbi:MAG: hypothetical protein ACI83W_001406 [Marinoscillum sp.]|jgi:hypothetical protein
MTASQKDYKPSKISNLQPPVKQVINILDVHN